MDIKVNDIVGSNGLTPPSFPDGLVISDGGRIDLYGNVAISGISTLSTLNIQQGTSSLVNSSAYVGDGSGLTGISTSSPSRVVGLKYIFADPPLRA